MRAYLVVSLKNTSLISTREEHPTCINGISTTLREPFPEVETRSKIFATFVNDFHPSLMFAWSISDEQLSFLGLVLKPTSDQKSRERESTRE